MPYFNWTASENAGQYTIEIATDAGFGINNIVKTVTTTSSAYLFVDGRDTPLECNPDTKICYWRVTATDSYGQKKFADPNIIVSDPAASAGCDCRWFKLVGPPQEFNLEKPSNGATSVPLPVTLYWHKSEEATHYYIEIYDSAGKPVLVLPGTSWPKVPAKKTDGVHQDAIQSFDTQSYPVPEGALSLIAGQTYSWNIRAVNSSFPSGVLSQTGPWTFTLLPPPEAIPTPVQPTSPPNGSSGLIFPINLVWAPLTWSPFVPAHHYDLEVAADAGFNQIVYSVSNISASTTQWTIPGPGNIFQPGGTSYWRVKAVNQFGQYNPAVPYASFTLKPRPGAFNLLKPYNGTPYVWGGAYFVWTPSDQADEYDFEFTTDATFSKFTSWVLTPQEAHCQQDVCQIFSTINKEHFSPGTTYYWRVRAWNSAGVMNASNAPFSFVTATLATDFNLVYPPTYDRGTELNPVLKWTDSTGEVKYRVEIYDASHQPPLTAADRIHFKYLSADQTSYPVPEGLLEPAKDYIWSVVAQSEGAETPSTPSSSRFTTACTAHAQCTNGDACLGFQQEGLCTPMVAMPPVPVRVSEGVAVIFPPVDHFRDMLKLISPPPTAEFMLGLKEAVDRIVAYEVYRNNSSDPITPPGGIDAATMNEKGFADRALSNYAPGRYPQYSVLPIYPPDYQGVKITLQSPWASTGPVDQAAWLTVQNYPLPQKPARIEINQNTAREAVVILGTEAESALAFQIDTLKDPNFSTVPPEGGYQSKIGARANADGDVSLLATLAENGLERTDYTGLPLTHDFLVLTGDLATAPLTASQRRAAVEQASLETLDLSQCTFWWGWFRCTSFQKSNAIRFTLPTAPVGLGRNLQESYFNPEDGSGLLGVPAWVNWLFQRQPTQPVYETTTPVGYLKAIADPISDPTYSGRPRLATTLALYEYQKMLEADKKYQDHDLGGHNLFGIGSLLLSDWMPALDEFYYQRLILPFFLSFAGNPDSLVNASQDFFQTAKAYVQLYKGMEEAFSALRGTGQRPNYGEFAQVMGVILRDLAELPGLRKVIATDSVPTSWDSNVTDDFQKIAVYRNDIEEVIKSLKASGALNEGTIPPQEADDVLWILKERHLKGHILCEELPELNWGEYLPLSDTINLKQSFCDRYDPFNGSTTLFHEGTHAYHERYFNWYFDPLHVDMFDYLDQTDPAPDWGLTASYQTWRQRREARVILFNLWTEMKGFWNESVFDGSLPVGTLRAVETEILEKKIINSGVYQALLGPLCAGSCSTFQDLGFYESLTGQRRQLSPVRKCSPFDEVDAPDDQPCPTPMPLPKECETDDQCGVEQVCRENICVTAPIASPEVTYIDDGHILIMPSKEERGVIGYEIYCDGQTAPIAVIDAETFSSQGVVDTKCVNTPTYHLVPKYDPNSSGVDKPPSDPVTAAPLVSFLNEFTYNHFIQPARPAEIKVFGQGAIRVIRPDPNGFLAFSPSLTEGQVATAGWGIDRSITIPLQSGTTSMDVTVASTGTDGLVPLPTYDGLLIAHSFWLITGDLAQASLTTDQLKAILTPLDATMPVIDTATCDFEFSQNRCSVPANSNVSKVIVHVPPETLSNAFFRMYLDPDTHIGFLASSAWQDWAASLQFDPVERLYDTDFDPQALINLMGGIDQEGLALGSATYDWHRMVIADKKDQEGYCLFRELCNDGEWADYFTEKISWKYIWPFQVSSSGLEATGNDWDAVVIGHEAAGAGFFPRDIGVYRTLKNANSSVLENVELMRFDTTNLNLPLFVNAVPALKPHLEALNRRLDNGSAFLKGMMMSVQTIPHQMVLLGCLGGVGQDPVLQGGCDLAREYLQTIATAWGLSHMTDEELIHFQFGTLVPVVLGAVAAGAELIRVTPLIFNPDMPPPLFGGFNDPGGLILMAEELPPVASAAGREPLKETMLLWKRKMSDVPPAVEAEVQLSFDKLDTVSKEMNPGFGPPPTAHERLRQIAAEIAEWQNQPPTPDPVTESLVNLIRDGQLQEKPLFATFDKALFPEPVDVPIYSVRKRDPVDGSPLAVKHEGWDGQERLVVPGKPNSVGSPTNEILGQMHRKKGELPTGEDAAQIISDIDDMVASYGGVPLDRQKDIFEPLFDLLLADLKNLRQVSFKFKEDHSSFKSLWDADAEKTSLIDAFRTTPEGLAAEKNGFTNIDVTPEVNQETGTITYVVTATMP